MILHRPSRKQGRCGICVDGVKMEFSSAPNEIKVNTHTFDTLSESYENSWGTMVTLRTPRISAVKETSLLTSSHFL